MAPELYHFFAMTLIPSLRGPIATTDAKLGSLVIITIDFDKNFSLLIDFIEFPYFSTFIEFPYFSTFIEFPY